MKIGNGSSSKGTGSQQNESGGPSKSKLHIHFPFGRSKDKKSKKTSTDNIKNSPSTSTSNAAPTLPPRGSSAGTPVGDDDIEDVRMLVNMGFTRAQAVAALEAHGYDVQKALNSLLT
jgi:epidermal growth factor receptor substrate 15